MQASGQPRNFTTPLAAAVVVALIGIAFLIITERNPAVDVQTKDISMITTAALERAGAVAVPTRPTVPTLVPFYDLLLSRLEIECLMWCISLLLAHLGHVAMSDLSPLSGAKQTLDKREMRAGKRAQRWR